VAETASEKCPQCNGLGYRYVEEHKGVIKCECKNEGRAGRLLAVAGIPKKFEACSLATYVPPEDNPTLQHAHAAAVEYVNLHINRPTPKGLLFQGSPGLGKTHLAVGIIRDLIERKGVPCYFCNFAGELQKIRDSMSAERTLNLPGLVYEADVES
jgi:DNA replication protein DnaC